MTAIEVVKARLVSIAALVEVVPASRMTSVRIPQSADLPAIRLHTVNERGDAHLRGVVNEADSLVQVDCIATTLAGAAAIEALVHGDGCGRDATGLNGWQGVTGTPPTRVDAVREAGRRERWDADELKRYVISRDYLVDWRPMT